MTSPVVPCQVCGLGTTAADQVCAACRPVIKRQSRPQPAPPRHGKAWPFGSGKKPRR